MGTDENILIAGIVVNDTAGKHHLARTAGPALTAFGVAGALAQPILRIFDDKGRELARNSAWESGPNGEDLAGLTKAVGAFPFAKGSKDAALLARLPAGQFTLQISSANTGTGVGLFELYEIDRGIGRTLNLSTRGLVHAGEELMIGGVVVRGPAPKRLLNAPPRRRARRASARGSPAARTPRAGPSPAPGSAADASRQARREKSFPRRRPPG